jgi:hypothetical protein
MSKTQTLEEPMEINITSFVNNEDPFEYSASRAERGENAGRDTWNNAKNLAPTLLTTPEQIEALREYVKGFGAWDAEEIAAWDDRECNALFVQLISGDMREAGMDDVDLEDFDWDEYEHQAEQGAIGGHIFRSDDGEIYFSLAS